MAFVLTGVGVEDDHAMVAVAVGDIEFVSLAIDEHLGGAFEIFDIVAALAQAGLADLHQKLPVLREFQDFVVLE